MRARYSIKCFPHFTEKTPLFSNRITEILEIAIITRSNDVAKCYGKSKWIRLLDALLILEVTKWINWQYWCIWLVASISLDATIQFLVWVYSQPLAIFKNKSSVTGYLQYVHWVNQSEAVGGIPMVRMECVTEALTQFQNTEKWIAQNQFTCPLLQIWLESLCMFGCPQIVTWFEIIMSVGRVLHLEMVWSGSSLYRYFTVLPVLEMFRNP